MRENKIDLVSVCFWNSASLLLEFMQAWGRNCQCQLTGLRNILCNVLGESLGI